MRKHRTALIMLTVIILVPCLAVAGLVTYKKWFNSHAITKGKPIPLTSGTGPNGESWQLIARVERNRYSSDHQTRLCLELLTANQLSAGQCEFDSRPSFNYWNSGQGPGSSIFFLGPVPPTATKVRIAGPGLKTFIVPTSSLPAMRGIPAGRYFIADPDPDGSVTARNDGRYWSVTPLDSSGRPVPFIDF